MALFVLRSTSAQKNVIANGDFETGSTVGWVRDRSPGGRVTVQSSIVRSGFYGLMIDTRGSLDGDCVYQGISLSDPSFHMEFWIYKETGKGNYVELLRDWDQSGPAYGASVIGFWENNITFATWTESRTTWDDTLVVVYTLSSGAWHNVTVNANAQSMKQELYIDDTFIAEKTSPWAYLPEWIVVGDISGAAMQGLFYYDDIRLTSSVPFPPPQVPEFPLGFVSEIAAIPTILYLWLRRKKQRTLK